MKRQFNFKTGGFMFKKMLNRQSVKTYEERGRTEFARGNFFDAAVWFQKILQIKPEDLDWLNITTTVLLLAGEYETALPLAEKALKISEDRYGLDHERAAACLNNLASIYEKQSLYEKAEPLFQRALKIWDAVLGQQHPFSSYRFE